MRLPLALLLSCGSVSAEGARQTYECRTSLACDDAGMCEAAARSVTFTFEPLSTRPDGSGDYRLLHDDTSASAIFTAATLDYLWSDGDDDQQRLMVAGQGNDGLSHLVWHSLDRTARRSTLLFLTCEVTL